MRNKRKCVTTVRGLDLFGVKLADAAKKFGKKFACGASVVKDAAGKEEIDVQARRPHAPRAPALAAAPRTTPPPARRAIILTRCGTTSSPRSPSAKTWATTT